MDSIPPLPVAALEDAMKHLAFAAGMLGATAAFADTPALINKDGGCSAWKWAYQWLRVKKSVANSCSDDFNQNFANANSWSQCIPCQYAVFQIFILPRIYLP